ncbi:molybdenum ABC transporter ATP-binding protein [Aureimonas phyllosphaerae]|uniref:Molybdate transport system ATP-binding protein n=1 Tax=Aureimonas phyllosphaerae TaxID=1166078 RepID=A0A7W6FT94_9HYPH|nr:molybdenum ABC transporter ATP-binding protein [Aureimonas phyllosphaerae]MBB3934470.1 molybdate transport system ATP-binding protein [Aureimonas phyllosphaerae]MBB3958314.1 molybdate transport system ATP-binding protein [Aureimonas phyllosphaerae]SFE95160.1 molybdate transport system ATP-binding protein [Aureimonas phyllosphaerae]
MIEARFRGALGGFTLDAAFRAPMRGVTALFGPSGCGKTTVLRCIAGLQKLDGRLSVGEAVWQDERHFLAPHRRPIGYVFQEASLFAHRSVRGNLLYGYDRAMRGRSEPPAIGFEEVCDLLGLDRLIDRAPRHLSGGERQRVSLGRALLSQPRLLLMDEPLSALDAMAKAEILPYFERLHARLNLPILLVTHDITEVERLADRLVLMRAGRVEAEGPLNDLLTDPALPFARTRGTAAVLSARVAGREASDGLVRLDLDGQPVLVAAAPIHPGALVRLRIAASDVSLALDQPSRSTILNVLRARIETITDAGETEAVITLALGAGEGQRLPARITRRSLAALQLAPGMDVYVQVKGASLSASPGAVEP